MSDARNSAAPNSFSGIRLVEFQIDNLFDEYTYKIPLNLGAHVTAIIAPNGTGKTLCLRLIAGLFEEKWSIFADNVFAKITYTFTDGTKVEITKPRSRGASEQEQNRQAFHLKINYRGDLVGEEWAPQLSADPRRILNVERYIPYVRRAGPNLWRDERTGEHYNLMEVMEEFGEILPESVKASFYGKKPEALTKLTSQIDCHLIETQRLLILREDAEPYYRTARHQPPSTLAISQKAEALKEIISLEINVYATLSQSLDRSFPRRLISEPNMLSPEELGTQLQALDERRKELMEAGILATEADDPVALPDGPLAPQISQVLSVYADDTRQKLASLSGLLAKIKLFKELVDERFVTKDILITRQNGIEVLFKNRKVPIERLSSGEQHQLVLFFELLFEIKVNSLILIDEPELSLHVAWQKKFIADLMKIIDLNRFDVILATHSPQLIGRWGDLVVELGEVDGVDDDEDAR